MTQLRELYRCEICGHIVEIAHEGAPTLVCCEQPMVKLQAKTEDIGQEKHVPVIEETNDGIEVKVGSIEHPMEEKHHIEFIEILTKERIMRAELKPAQAPKAKCCVSKSDVLEVREFCNVHGLWKNK